VLGGGQGTLVVDGHSGYNRLFTPDGWSRAGCLAHVLRKFYEAQDSAPDEARRAMELVLDVYRVEHLAKELGIIGTRKCSGSAENGQRF
jgi:transposase